MKNIKICHPRCIYHCQHCGQIFDTEKKMQHYINICNQKLQHVSLYKLVYKEEIKFYENVNVKILFHYLV